MLETRVAIFLTSLVSFDRHSDALWRQYDVISLFLADLIGQLSKTFTSVILQV